MNKRRGHDFSEVRTNNRDSRPSIRDQVDLLKFPPGKFVTVRIISPVFMYAGYWVMTKKKDGKTTRFYMPSPSYDPEAQTFDSTKYDPFLAVSNGERGVDRDARLIQIAKYGYCNAIILHEEQRRPERLPRPTEQELQTGFKEKDSDSWTPVKVLRLSATMLEQIQGIAQTNIVTNRRTGEQKAMSIAHPQFGMTLRIKHSPDKPASSQYQILPGEKAPLTERQQKYLTWDLSDLERPADEETLRVEYERWAERMGIAESSDEDDGFDDEENPARRPAKKAVKKGAKRPPAQEDDWDDSADDAGDDAGDDAAWDDGDGGDDEGWEEEPPRRPSKKAVKKSGKKAPPAEDWDDGADDAEDSWDDGGEGGDESWDDGSEGAEESWEEGGGDDGWEEEPPKRPVKNGAKKAARQPVAEDDWDDDSGDDDAAWDDGDDAGDDAWEEEPPRRPAKKAVKKGARPAKKAARRPAADEWE